MDFKKKLGEVVAAMLENLILNMFIEKMTKYLVEKSIL